MSFKDMAAKILGEKIEQVSITPPPTELKESLTEELDLKIDVERIVTEKSELNFVGSFNYVPDPIEYGEGAIYKNVNEGVAYIRKGLLWEELVRDGKPGRDAARVGGSGVGVAEVKSITGNLGTFASISELNLLDTTNIKIGQQAYVKNSSFTYMGQPIGWEPSQKQTNITKIGFLGDSITNGSTAGNFLYAFPQQTIYLCGGRVALEDSIEFGNPGENTKQMASRLQTLVDSGVGVVVLLCGANDAGQGVSVDSWSKSIIEISKVCLANDIKLIQILPLPQGSSSTTNAHKLLTSYRLWLFQSAKSLGITIVNPYKLTNISTGYLDSTVDSDGIHPNQLGHQIIAQETAKTILSVVGSTMNQSLPLSPTSWLNGVSNPLMSGTNTPSGGYEQPGGTGTTPIYSCLYDTSGTLPNTAKWWQSSISATSNTTRIMAMGASTLSFTIGDAALLHAKIQVEDISGDWLTNVINGSGATAQLSLNSGGVDKHVCWYACPGLGNGNGVYNYDVYYYVPSVQATAFEIWLRCGVPSGSYYKIKWSCVQLYNLSALGINGLGKMPIGKDMISL